MGGGLLVRLISWEYSLVLKTEHVSILVECENEKALSTSSGAILLEFIIGVLQLP
jgi:hypothetical protein